MIHHEPIGNFSAKWAIFDQNRIWDIFEPTFESLFSYHFPKKIKILEIPSKEASFADCRSMFSVWKTCPFQILSKRRIFEEVENFLVLEKV